MESAASFLLGLLFGTGLGALLGLFLRRQVEAKPVEHDPKRLRVPSIAPVVRLRNVHDRSLPRRGH